MKALVLGGNGFIGSHIVDLLLSDGHSVRVFDRGPEIFRKPLSNVDYRLAPFDDVPALAEAIEGMDVVYHLISTTVPSTSNKDPVYDIESNLISTIRLLNLIRDSSVSHIIYLSSGGTVYGIPENSPILETHPLRPICSYGVVKVSIENYIRMYSYLYGIEYTVFRASNPYGERQGHTGTQGVIGTFMGKIIADEPIEIWGDGSVVRDFIYIKDLANLCVQAGISDSRGIFNVGNGKGSSINEIISVLSTVCDKDIKTNYLHSRPYDVPHITLDISKAIKEFSWNPRTDLLKGIQSTWKWAMRQKNEKQ